MKRLICLLLTMSMLCACLPVSAELPVNNTRYAFRAEDVLAHYPKAFLLCDEWTRLATAGNNIDLLVLDVINKDADTSALQAALRDTLGIAKTNFLKLIGLTDEDYIEKLMRQAASDYYRAIIASDSYSGTSVIAQVNEDFHFLKDVAQDGYESTEDFVTNWMLKDNLKLLRESFGDAQVEKLLSYFMDLDFYKQIQKSFKRAKLTGYAIDVVQYAVAFAEMMSVDVGMLNYLIRTLPKDDALYEGLMLYKNYISQDLTEYYFKEMFLSDQLFDFITEKVVETLFLAGGGLYIKIAAVVWDVLGGYFMDQIFSKTASLEEVNALALYMQYNLSLQMQVQRIFSTGQGDATFKEASDELEMLIAAYVRGLDTLLGKFLTVRKLGKLNKQDKALYKEALNSISRYKYKVLVKSACEYATKVHTEGLDDCGHDPYHNPIEIEWPEDEIGQAIRTVMGKYPPNDFVGYKGSSRLFVNEVMAELSHGNTKLIDTPVDYGFALEAEQLSPTGGAGLEQLAFAPVYTTDYLELVEDLRAVLLTARCGDVLCAYSGYGQQVSLIWDATKSKVTLYDSGSVMRRLSYTPQGSIGYYDVSINALAKWLVRPITKGSEAIAGYALYRFQPATEPEPEPEPEQPILDPTSSGSGTQADPYRLSTAEDLFALAARINGGDPCEDVSFVLTQNIALNQGMDLGVEWIPMRSFKGTLDGAGHAITGLYVPDAYDVLKRCIDEGTAQSFYFEPEEGYRHSFSLATNSFGAGSGLFTQIEREGTVRNLTVSGRIDTAYYGGLALAGGIAGKNLGKVQNCQSYITFFHRTNDYASYYGGICGENSGQVSNCLDQSRMYRDPAILEEKYRDLEYVDYYGVACDVTQFGKGWPDDMGNLNCTDHSQDMGVAVPTQWNTYQP